MMRRQLLLIVCCLFAAIGLAQQQLDQHPRVQSPVIHADGSVTFNFYAPSAQHVSVNGDFEEIRNKCLDMTKQEDSVWTVTTAPLRPELP